MALTASAPAAPFLLAFDDDDQRLDAAEELLMRVCDWLYGNLARGAARLPSDRRSSGPSKSSE